MGDLTSAIMIACEMHEEQTDKAGQPYILHPLRVMLMMETEVDRLVGVLHDVAEDNEEGWARMHDAGFDPEIIEAIDSVTRREGEDYEDFIDRAAQNPIGRRVKIADLLDNLSRPRSLPASLKQRYERAIRKLRG
jgi:(p)ppGpp synthase/HD superfamily hydrolase